MTRLQSIALTAAAALVAGATLLAAGTSDRPAAPTPPPADSPTRMLTTPAAQGEPLIRRLPVLADQEQVCLASLKARAERRAYDGAPPVIPHDVESFTHTKSCLDCHGAGFKMGAQVARAMPHPYLAACEQCHVTAEAPLAFAARAAGPSLPSSTFEGRFRTGPSTRAWAEAPPTMPHGTLMRTNCLACHGRLGWAGLQTSHPERANCIQCHVSQSGQPEGLSTRGDAIGGPAQNSRNLYR
ncbi:MAG: nitrate reductase cytochrome c-type subunit [Phycisphaerales bacterium]|jgi:cytochrome c-type protein NapB|nr:nitrate reductase cytochrome c-type subunit [Phycisphaerales bacterium]